MKEPAWVLPAVARSLHSRLLAEHGGADGIRDEGALDAALGRPRQIFSYGKPTLHEPAAAYAGGLVRNHPFVDGNKRVGFMLSYVFLRTNGHKLTADEAEAAIMTLGLAAGRIPETEYSEWLRRNGQAVKRDR